MSATAFNFGGGKLHTTLSKKTINANADVVVTLPKCSVCVITYSTTWSDRWNRGEKGVISGSAIKKDFVIANYSAMNHGTYVYTNVAESTTIDFGSCPSQVNIQVACIK